MQTELTTFFTVLPKHCNHHMPMIFGGHFMAEMDIAAAILVAKLLTDSATATYAVTHKYEGTFFAAAQMGDIIELRCKITEVRKRGIGVEVCAYRQKRSQKEVEYIAKSNFVFVSKNGDKFVEHGLTL